MEKIKIEWLGHSCFKLSFGDWTVVLDPYRDGSVEGLGDLRLEANMVLASHSHGDHNAVDLVKVTEKEGAPVIKRVKSFHDDRHGAKRGENLITVFEYRGKRLVHFGDLGHLISDETARQIGKPDVIMIPVGGFFTIDAATAKRTAEKLGAKTVIPMHYRGESFGFGVLTTLKDFTDLYENVTYAGTSEVTIDENTPRGVLVLNPAMVER